MHDRARDVKGDDVYVEFDMCMWGVEGVMMNSYLNFICKFQKENIYLY